MPISCKHPIKPLSQKDFGDIAYEVMGQVFAVHNELGRLFEEEVYKKEIARRLSDALTEVPIEVYFEDFCKTFYLDLMVGNGAIFEFKAVDFLVPRHVAQLLNYLLLVNACHGKIINMRAEDVEHEFVNTKLTRVDRVSFLIRNDGWLDKTNLMEWFIALLRDWGVGLDISLYESAVKHRFDPNNAFQRLGIVASDGQPIGSQDGLLVAPATAVRLTAMPEDRLSAFEHHLSKFFRHTSLDTLQWINMSRQAVRFRTIDRSSLVL
jgi:GxxExxY protein